MQVNLLHYTPLSIAMSAIRTCWQSHGKSDAFKLCSNCSTKHDDLDAIVCSTCDEDFEGTEEIECGDNDLKLIDRVANKYKHASTIEHITYNFEVKGVSRALLQELARHRIASYSVKSSRYTLKELKHAPSFVTHLEDGKITISNDQYKEAEKFIVFTGDHDVDFISVLALDRLQVMVKMNKSNDITKYCMPECYKTDLHWTINARSLKNFLQLRSSKSALWEIQQLAREVFKSIPDEHKFLFEDVINT